MEDQKGFKKNIHTCWRGTDNCCTGKQHEDEEEDTGIRMCKPLFSHWLLPPGVGRKAAREFIQGKVCVVCYLTCCVVVVRVLTYARIIAASRKCCVQKKRKVAINTRRKTKDRIGGTEDGRWRHTCREADVHSGNYDTSTYTTIPYILFRVLFIYIWPLLGRVTGNRMNCQVTSVEGLRRSTGLNSSWQVFNAH